MHSDPGGHTAQVALPSDTEAVLTRAFDFPPALVFEMWTKPEHVRRWYGMREYIMSACDIDLRVGGRWRWAQTTFDGDTIAFSGEYRDIATGARLVFTELFEALPDRDYLVTMTFAGTPAGATVLTTHMQYQTREHRDGALQSGMADGTEVVYRRQEELMAGLQHDIHNHGEPTRGRDDDELH
jgi:uncharacterized protein YndB with AHSA1/START domain